MRRTFFPLAGFILLSELAGVIGSIFTVGSIPTWYAGLRRPSFAPPNWVFGPVWTTLFLLMGIAAFLVWKRGWQRRDVKAALAVFGVQLVLNTCWSIIFFGLHSPGLALAEIVLLWLAIAATTALFYKISRAAAYLFLPYLAWVTFAAWLNFAIWRLL